MSRVFDTRVAGIPCQCAVTYYQPAEHRIINSASLEPNDELEFEFEILDRRGRPAPWLERKLTDDDHERLLKEFLDEINPY